MADFPTFSRKAEHDFVTFYEDSVLKSSAESGYVLTRKKYSKDRKSFLGYKFLMMTTADRLLLTNFLVEVEMGALPFNWVNPDDTATYIVRLTEIPKIGRAFPGYYSFEFGFVEV
jgi:hypothetical protein